MPNGPQAHADERRERPIMKTVFRIMLAFTVFAQLGLSPQSVSAQAASAWPVKDGSFDIANFHFKDGESCTALAGTPTR